MLLRSQLPGDDWPRPLAVVENGRPGRFVAQAKTLIVIDGDNIGLARSTPDMVEAVERSEEHTSELQSLMRISYAVFCLKKKKPQIIIEKQNKYQTIQNNKL